MRALSRVLPFLRPYRGTFVAGFACVLASNFLTTLAPRFLQQGIDALHTTGAAAELRRALLLMVGVAFVGGLARYGMRELLNGVSRRAETDLRDRLFEHLTTLSAPFFDRFPTGDLMARVTNDLLAVRMVMGPAVMYLVDTLTRTALVLPYMLHISPGLTGIALLPLLGLPIGMMTLGQAMHRRSLAIQTQYGTLTTAVHENLAGVRIVRAYRQEMAEIARFRTINAEYADRNLALARVAAAFHPLLGLIGGLGAVAVIYLGGRQVMQGTMTVGAFVAFGIYLITLVWPMIALGWVVNLVQRGAAAMDRIVELLDTPPDITAPARPATLPPAGRGRSLVFEDVWFRYPAARDRGWALQALSFSVPAGGALGVVGATGTGKSTLAELICRTYDPDRGRILLDGVDIRTLEPAELRRQIGFVPQETFLFSATVRENVLLGAPDDGRLERAAETSQLTAALRDLPLGYDTMLGERGINLSGGQKQRAAIARALAQDPPVFVLDDSLSAVDAQTEMRILRGLRDALARRTRVIISHRLSAVRETDQVLVLEDGRIVEQGPPAVLMEARGRYWTLLRRQEMEEALSATGATTTE
jgi:ATP-binding cassette, subfamily B, multidrug efflux pump